MMSAAGAFERFPHDARVASGSQGTRAPGIDPRLSFKT